MVLKFLATAPVPVLQLPECFLVILYRRLQGEGGGGRQRGLKSTIHASLAVKSTFHILSHTKSKSTHTKFKNEEGKPKNTIFKLDTFQCCHRIIVTMYFLSDFTQIKAWSHLQHFLATSVHYVLHAKRFRAWPGLTDHILH